MESNTRNRIRKISRWVFIGLLVNLFFLLLPFGYYAQVLLHALSTGTVEEIASSLFNCLGMAMGIGALAVASLLFRSILRHSTPFVPSVTRKLKWIGVLLLGLTTVPKWVAQIVLLLYAQSRDFVLFDELGAIGLVAGGMFFCLGIIFEYGCLLQQESDETL